jgi:putative ABC transport system permease protein
MGLMSVAVGFAVIYNISKVSLSERSRELATMRVLGMTVRETNEIIAFEHWILSIVGIIAGIPITIGMRFALSNMMDMEMFVIPGRTAPEAFLLAALGCMCMVFMANQADRGAIRKFDLVEVLKERE